MVILLPKVFYAISDINYEQVPLSFISGCYSLCYLLIRLQRQILLIMVSQYNNL